MKTKFCISIFAAAIAAATLNAQPSGPSRPPARSAQPAVSSTGNYADDIVVVSDAQQQALDQAQQQLAQGQGDQAALGTAIKEMQRAQAALAAAKNSPDKLPAAIAAEQAAYQALLKATPREFNVQRQRNNQGQNSGQQSSGQPNQQQLDQLELTQQQNRYETERQAATPQNAQQREQTQTADRLKELAQRQQDLNDRMRELQTALQAARTDQQRADIQQQLKRLEDEQRQQLANVDELRQQIAQSPNASSQTDTEQKLDQTRQDMQRASEELQNQSASQALAAGTRAQQNMQNLREDLRRQTGSEFSDQMREMRNDARDLVKQQDDITSKLDALNNDTHQSLDDSAQRQQLVQQMARQQSTLTNLLAGMRDVTEQAETTEPLLSKQLYDTLRREDQMHTDNLLDMGSQLTERGFLPQAGEASRAARTNITELASSVERAADSVLGSEADALRYAQKQLDDLTRQVEQEIGQTNSGASIAGENGGAQNESNRLARATENASGGQGTNGIAGANGRAAGNRGTNEIASANGNNSQLQQGERNSPNGNQNGNRGQQQNGQRGQGEAQTGNNGQRGNGGQPNGNNNSEQASAENQQNGQSGQGQAAAGNNGQRASRGNNQQQANNNSPGQNNSGQPGQNGRQQGDQNDSEQQAANGGGNADRLRQFAEQLGQNTNRAQDNGGPITGNGFVNFSDQLRDVQNVLDSPDLRNQLATIRDRAAGLRAEYRGGRRPPPRDAVREQLLLPLEQVRVWVQEELSRQEKADSLVPLDRDPVPEKYSDLVRTYYENLGSAK